MIKEIGVKIGKAALNTAQVAVLGAVALKVAQVSGEKADEAYSWAKHKFEERDR